MFVLLAHKAPEDLGMFSYTLALLSVISTVFPLVLATAGNKAASLIGQPSDLHDFFAGGFTLSLIVGILTATTCLLAVQLASEVSGTQQWDGRDFWSISLVYMMATPIIATNAFLQMFLEATGKATHFTLTKLKITLMCSMVLMLSYEYSDTDDFKYCAMLYFFLTELMTLLFLLKMSRQQRYVSIRYGKIFAGYFLRTGFPIAAGMSGQKIYFYLLMERLARIESSLVAELSVFMTITGILLIPSLALTQIHSFQVSQHLTQSSTFYRSGLKWVIGTLLLTALVFTLIGEHVFQLVGDKTVNYSGQMFMAVILFIATSSFLSLAVAHLRARGETLKPQLLVNIIMLGVLVPLLYALHLDRPGIETFLMFQSGAAAVAFLILNIRIVCLHKSDP